jgi:hypothetical protein
LYCSFSLSGESINGGKTFSNFIFYQSNGILNVIGTEFKDLTFSGSCGSFGVASTSPLILNLQNCKFVDFVGKRYTPMFYYSSGTPTITLTFDNCAFDSSFLDYTGQTGSVININIFNAASSINISNCLFTNMKNLASTGSNGGVIFSNKAFANEKFIFKNNKFVNISGF